MIKLYGTLVIFMLFPWNSLTKMRSYKHIGCFKDDWDRALPIVLGSMTSTAKVEECAFKANEKGYPVFSLQAGYECFSGPTADKTYYKYGPSTDCDTDGLGDHWANDVYQFAADGEILWPKGTFSLLKPSSGCPTDFIDNGWLIQDTLDQVTNNRSTVLSIDGYVTKGYVSRSFCTKTVGTFGEWPEGQYCIYKEGGINPPKLTDGWIRMDNSFNNNKDVVKMVYNNGIYLRSYYFNMYFYCQTTGEKSVPIDLPISHPFYLLPYGSSDCQQVKWIVATKQWIQYATRNFKEQPGQWNKPPIPYIEAGSKERPSVTMFYCLYTSCNKTLNETQGVFQSPGYPDKYPNGQLCSWTIVVPANHTVLVHFTHFALDDTNVNNSTDVLELHVLTNNSFQINTTYTGNKGPFQITLTRDVQFVFRSNKASGGFVGFRAEYNIFVPQERTTGRPTIVNTYQPPTTKQNSSIEPDIHVPTIKISSTTTNLPQSTSSESPSVITRQSSPSITGTDMMNKTIKVDALKANSESTGTAILIVIPLVCCILIVVVAIDIYYRRRTSNRRKDTKEEPSFVRSDEHFDHEQVATNPTYGRTEEFPMTHYNTTCTAAKTTIDSTNELQDNDTSYERLSRFSPRREVPEDYQELDRTSYPNSTNITSLTNAHDNQIYQGFESPSKSEHETDDDMYHTIDTGSCSNNVLYEKTILYDSVA